MKKISFISIVVIALVLSGCSSKLSTENGANKASSIKIAVSVVPQQAFVEAVGGDKVEVITMIPTGYSPANYEPTPMEMAKFQESKVYFSIGVATEEANILPMIKENDAEIKVVDLAESVRHHYDDLYLEEHEHDHDEHEDEDGHEDDDAIEEGLTRDPHIWLSPKRVVVMINTIRDELSSIDPENKAYYEKNTEVYIQSLEKVDQELTDIFDGLDNKEFIIYHPSFGYFADDYGLQMTTIEADGKEATVKRISQVVDYAKEHQIKVVFYQEEFDSKQAEVIANEIEGTVIKVAPLSGDYINNLKSMAEKFKQVFSN